MRGVADDLVECFRCPISGWLVLGGKILQEHRDARRMEKYLPLNRVNPASPLPALLQNHP